MTVDKSFKAGGNISGVVIVTGDHNVLKGNKARNLSKDAMPPLNTVNIRDEIAAIRVVLRGLGGEHAAKIARALDDAEEEIGKAQPDKNEVGSAIERALIYANKGGEFAEHIEKLAPYVSNSVAWLGTNWHKLLPLVGLAF